MSPSQKTDRACMLRNLPQDMMIDILSRLPVRSILWCKCVCKSWRDLIECPDFIIMHHHKSTSSASSGLALLEVMVASGKAFKICDEVAVDRCTTMFNFALPTQSYIRSSTSKLRSVNGLLLVSQTLGLRDLFICNPITREYVHIVPPKGPLKPLFNFGVSKITGQYKVVMISRRSLRDEDEPYNKCMVYYMDTMKWRSIATCRHSDGESDGVFFNGNLHWLGFDFDDVNQKRLISSFDLETEQFTSFSLPPRYHHVSSYFLSDLKGHLCLSESRGQSFIVIWSMNKYGDDNSWTKEFIINTQSILEWKIIYGVLYPVKVFEDGEDILLGVSNNGLLFIYSNKDKSIRKYDHLRVGAGLVSSTNINYNPTFLSLKAMGFQNVDTTLNHL